MKSNIKIIFLILLLFTVSRCKNIDNSKLNNELSEYGISENVKSFTSKKYHTKIENGIISKGELYEGTMEETYMFNSDGKLIEVIFDSPTEDMNGRSVVKYDDEGRRIKIEWISSNGMNTVTNYSYGKDDMLDEIVTNYEDGELVDSYTYKYDENGNEIESKWFIRGSSKPSIISRKTYDENGNMIIDSLMNSDGGLNDLSKYKYDEQGRTIEMILNELQNPYVYKLYREYDNQGNVVKYIRKKYTFEGKFLWTQMETVKYDSRNSWIEKISYSQNKPELIEERVIDYFD